MDEKIRGTPTDFSNELKKQAEEINFPSACF